MYIGDVSKLTGLTVKTIRFYEQKKLISIPERKGRYRIYNQKIIDQLFLIIKAKSLGFTLNQFFEIQKLSSSKNMLQDSDSIDWSVVFEYLENMQLTKKHTILKIENEINEIETMKLEIKECF
ncbi:MerR family transcriptional regulator [Marinicellulosiphila megalodicopiae]|uniref:MerR family transcriptional regulator n=1 Tax=Marinicellulosiphila megalodicopiae TaxID=2724896 RepID=UPI003BB0D113